MKFFLSSIRPPNNDELTELFGNKKELSVGIIPNAWDTYTDEIQNKEVAEVVSNFKELGFKTSIIDLTTDANIDKKVESNDFLWVMGGNTFYLNYKIHMTGFDKMISDAIGKGVIYGGSSAGAVVVGPTLHGVENVDDPKDAPEIIWDGLSLVDVGIVPHWGIAKYSSQLEKMKDEMLPYVAQIVTLTNDQAVTIINGQRQLR
jgi:dipeptidase E